MFNWRSHRKSILILILFFFGCNSKPDFKNPQSVSTFFLDHVGNGDFAQAYTVVADTSKSFTSLSEFKRFYKDKEYHLAEIEIENVEKINIGASYPNLRLFEYYIEYQDSKTNSRINSYEYLTTFKQDGSWKILWFETLLESADKYNDSSNYEKSNQVYRKIIDLNPLSGYAIAGMGWNYIRMGNSDKAMEKVEKSIELYPNLISSYSLLSTIHLMNNNNDLALIKINESLRISNNYSDSVYVLSNSSIIKSAMNKKEEAINDLNHALKIDSTVTHVWWRKGALHKEQENIKQAINSFEKAISLEPLPDHQQAELYFDYSKTLYDCINLKCTDTPNKLVDRATENIEKALSLRSEDQNYLDLYKKLKGLNLTEE